MKFPLLLFACLFLTDFCCCFFVWFGFGAVPFQHENGEMLHFKDVDASLRI